MRMDRKELIRYLQAQIHVNGHIIGAAVGSGMTAKYVSMGGADLLLALSAGKYRLMGRSSYGSYLCYGNNNEQVMEMGKRELFPILKDKPVLFGLFASDPSLSLYDYLKEIREAGFSGIVNYPTVSLIDGKFREAIEEEGCSFAAEVEAVSVARMLDLFTIGFVRTAEEAKQMAEAGADVVCLHLGLTKGGFLGAKRQVSIDEARRLAQQVFLACRAVDENILRMIYAGPANTPVDMLYLYQNTDCQGYIGGSTFDRIPIERALLNTTRAFKSYGSFEPNDPLTRLINGEWDMHNAVHFVQQYIDKHYMEEIHLGDLALVAHLSPSYLSAKFKKETGTSFTQYLVRYRMNKAKDLLQSGDLLCREAAQSVGYTDYTQFSKMFKKYIGTSPAAFQALAKESRMKNGVYES